MLSSSKHFTSFWLSTYRGLPGVADELCRLAPKQFCTISETPRLPFWINENSDAQDMEEDFVIPSIADWIKDEKVHDNGQVATKIVDTNFEKVNTILQTYRPSPDDIVRALNGCSDITVSERLVEHFLNRYSNEWILAYGVFVWARAHPDYKHSANSYNSMIDILARCRKFDLVWNLMEEMSALEGYISLLTMAKVMRRLARAHKPEDAVDVFRRIERFGVKKDVSALNALMDALVKGDNVELAEKVLSEFEDEIPPTSQTFNILIHGWSKCRKLDTARKAMEKMRERGLHPDVVSYTSLVEAYCRERDFRNVDALFAEMEEKGCSPNLVTYTIYMHGLGKTSEIGRALEVYEKLKCRGHVPDAACYSSLIYGLCRSGRLKDAYEIFADMSKQGVVPDAATYNTVISAACDNGQEETALAMLREMEGNSCKPDLRTYVPLLKMCCRKKRMKVLRFLLQHMSANEVSIELGTYTLLVHGLCRSGKLEDACSFFGEMISKGFLPKDVTYKLLVKELGARSMEREKKQVEELMLQLKKRHVMESPNGAGLCPHRTPSVKEPLSSIMSQN